MSTEEVKGILINGKVISAVVGVFTIVTMLFSAVGFIVYQSFELNQAKEDIAQLESKHDADVSSLRLQIESANRETRENYQMILDKMDALTGEVTKLTIAVGNVQYKQDNAPLRR